jgi:uncharacterized protein YraI
MKLRGILIAALLLIVPTAAMAARGIVTDTVSLRAGPGVGFPVVDRIPGGAHVNIHGCLRGDAWCDISWAGDRGWVSSEYLQYFYRSRYVYLPDYVDVIDVPVVPFVLGTYWANYYAGRPFFHRRAHWASYWRSHARIAEQPVRGGAIARTRGGEERFGRVDREQRGFRENRAFRENMERGRTARINERGAFERRGGVGINERRGVSVNERRGLGVNERRGLGVNERRGVAGMRQPVAGPQGRIEGRQFGHGGQPAFQARGGEPRAMGRPPMAAGAGAGPRTVGQAGGASQAQMGGGPRAPAAAPHAMGGGAPHMAAPGGGGGMAGPRGGGHGRPH